MPLLHNFLRSFAVFFFMSKRISQHSGKILNDVLLTCHLAGWADIFFQCRADIFNISPTCRHLSERDVMWGSWQYDMMPTFPTKSDVHDVKNCHTSKLKIKGLDFKIRVLSYGGIQYKSFHQNWGATIIKINGLIQN